MTGIIASRLKPALRNLILQTQKCAVEDRRISDILRNIQAVLEYANERKRETLIVNLDQQKALKSV